MSCPQLFIANIKSSHTPAILLQSLVLQVPDNLCCARNPSSKWDDAAWL